MKGTILLVACMATLCAGAFRTPSPSSATGQLYVVGHPPPPARSPGKPSASGSPAAVDPNWPCAPGKHNCQKNYTTCDVQNNAAVCRTRMTVEPRECPDYRFLIVTYHESQSKASAFCQDEGMHVLDWTEMKQFRSHPPRMFWCFDRILKEIHGKFLIPIIGMADGKSFIGMDLSDFSKVAANGPRPFICSKDMAGSSRSKPAGSVRVSAGVSLKSSTPLNLFPAKAAPRPTTTAAPVKATVPPAMPCVPGSHPCNLNYTTCKVINQAAICTTIAKVTRRQCPGYRFEIVTHSASPARATNYCKNQGMTVVDRTTVRTIGRQSQDTVVCFENILDEIRHEFAVREITLPRGDKYPGFDLVDIKYVQSIRDRPFLCIAPDN